MPLIIAPEGRSLLVKKVIADSKIRKHLESLGIVENQTIEIMSKQGRGMIVLINSTRLALDKNISSSIFVE